MNGAERGHIMTEGFLVQGKTLELFFRMCRRYKIDSVENRTALLREITRRGRAKYLRDVEAAIEGKKVLYIKRKRSHNEN